MSTGELWIIHVGKNLRVPTKVFALETGVSTRELVEAALREYLETHAEDKQDDLAA